MSRGPCDGLLRLKQIGIMYIHTHPIWYENDVSDSPKKRKTAKLQIVCTCFYACDSPSYASFDFRDRLSSDFPVSFRVKIEAGNKKRACAECIKSRNRPK